MLKDTQAETLMRDAHAIQGDAMVRLDAGDWRDAAEKSWCAVRNATQAVIIEATGVNNPHSTGVNSGIRKLAHQRGGEWVRLREKFSEITYQLHIEAFYGGMYEDDLPNLVRSVADYLRLAEELAAE